MAESLYFVSNCCNVFQVSYLQSIHLVGRFEIVRALHQALQANCPVAQMRGWSVAAAHIRTGIGSQQATLVSGTVTEERICWI